VATKSKQSWNPPLISVLATPVHVAYIIGMGIIGIDQPMLCIQLMNMSIMSIICCDIILTTFGFSRYPWNSVRAGTTHSTVGLFERWRPALGRRSNRRPHAARRFALACDRNKTGGPTLDPLALIVVGAVPDRQTTVRIRKRVVDRRGRSLRFLPCHRSCQEGRRRRCLRSWISP
jgi:hypothetical protein